MKNRQINQDQYEKNYRMSGNVCWIPYPYPFSTATLLESNYRWSLHLKFNMESFYANPKVTMNGSADELTLNITKLHPKCYNEKDTIQINASGGMPHCYCMVGSKTILKKNPLIADPVKLSEGNHKTTVVDSNSCRYK